MAIQNILGSAGFVDQGDYSASTTYKYLNIVKQNNHWYLCRLRTGVLNIAPPATFIDSTQWRAFVESGDNNLSGISKNDTTGQITVTRKGLSDFTFQQGHRLYTNGTAHTQHREDWNIIGGNVNFRDGTQSGETFSVEDAVNWYLPEIKPGTAADATILNQPGFGGADTQQWTYAFKGLNGKTDEIVIVEGADSAPNQITAPQIPVNTAAQESLVGENGTIKSIRDVSGVEPADRDGLLYNSVTKQYEPNHMGAGTLDSLTDFDGTGAVDGDIIEYISRAGRFDIEPLHVSNGSGLSIKTPGGELITSPAGYPTIRQINIIWNHDQASSTRDIYLSNGNTHVDIVINFSFAENINNVITQINAILNMSQYTSFYSWGDTTNVGDRERDLGNNGFYTLVGDWSTKDNTRSVSASASSGSIGFQDDRHGGTGSFDVVNFKFSIETEGFSVHQQRIIINGTAANSFADINTLVLAGIKTITDIETHFTVTSPSDGTISFVSTATGAEWNGTLYINFFSTTEPQQDPSSTVGPFGGAHSYLRGGQVASSSQVVEWTDTSNRQLENISFINCISFFKNGGSTYKVVTPAALTTALIASPGELDTFRGSGFTAGSEFVVTGAAVTALLTPDLAAQVSIEFPAAPGNNSLLGLTGMFNGANDSFFQIRTASDPAVQPTTVFFGNFAAQAGDVFLRQNNGTQLLFLNQADGDNDGAVWATNTLALFNTMVTAGDTGIQATGFNSTVTGAFISANCTAEIIGDRTLVFTANETGATGGAALSEASDSANNYTTTFVQGAAATRTVNLTQNNKYIVLNSTTLLNITDGTTVSVI